MIKKLFFLLKRYYKKIFVKKEITWNETRQSYGLSNRDKIFYIIRRKDQEVGLFSIYNVNLGHILYAINNGYIPIIDMKNYFNSYLPIDRFKKDNAWEYYFYQPTRYLLEEAYKSKNVILSSGDPINLRPRDEISFFYNQGGELDKWREIAKKYLRVREDILDEINTEFNELICANDKVLGVLARGTDYTYLMPAEHPKQPTVNEVILKTKEFLDEINYSKIFLATEDKDIYNEFKKEFGEMCITNKREFIEYTGGRIPDYFKTLEHDCIKSGKEYLTTIVMLSRCNSIIASRTSGAVGAFILSKGFENTYIFDKGRY